MTWLLFSQRKPTQLQVPLQGYSRKVKGKLLLFKPWQRFAIWWSQSPQRAAYNKTSNSEEIKTQQESKHGGTLGNTTTWEAEAGRTYRETLSTHLWHEALSSFLMMNFTLSGKPLLMHQRYTQNSSQGLKRERTQHLHTHLAWDLQVNPWRYHLMVLGFTEISNVAQGTEHTGRGMVQKNTEEGSCYSCF